MWQTKMKKKKGACWKNPIICLIIICLGAPCLLLASCALCVISICWLVIHKVIDACKVETKDIKQQNKEIKVIFDWAFPLEIKNKQK